MDESSRADVPRHESKIGVEEIRSQLERILVHPEFHATDRLREFLRFVVEQSLAGRATLIKGRTVARHVFGRGADFDAARDPIVRIEAGRLRRAIERYYLVAGSHDPIRIDMPKGRYVPRFTRQAALATRRSDDSSLDRPDRPPAEEGPTVAIFPFRDLTGNPQQAFFVNGLVEELVNELNHYEGFVAVPCRPPGSGLDLDDPPVVAAGGAPIDARFVLGGSVRRDEAEVKIAAQLTDTRTSRHVWAESYKVPLEASTLIATQEELAREVIAAIAGEYGVIARRLTRESRQLPPTELSTYEALLRYHHYMLTLTPEAGEEAFRALSRATQSDPDYGPAWAALAILHVHAYIFDRPGFDAPLETALELARRGVALAPDSQLARTVLSYVLLLQGEVELFASEAETALALNPHSPNFTGTIGYLLAISGHLERGAALLRRAIGQNPSHPRWFHHGLFLVHYMRGEYEQAYRESEQIGHQVAFWDPVLRAAALGKLGRIEEAEAAMEEVRRLKPEFERRVLEILPRTATPEEFWPEVLDGLRKAGLRADGC